MTQPDLFAPAPPAPPERPPVPMPTPDRQPAAIPARKLVAQVIDAAQDFEFYPTTDEIIRALMRDLETVSGRDYREEFSSFLDIGAGNGKVLLAIKAALAAREDRYTHRLSKNPTLHAIEKSTILCQQLPADILIVGTEFEEQSLLSKSVDVVFSNPPYSQFEQWAEKIIRQSASRLVYLVIPTRWEKSVPIQDAIRFRQAEVKQVGTYNFHNAERQARAEVHLLRIELNFNKGDDAFERFFKEQFAGLIGKFEKDGRTPEDPDQEEPKAPERAFAQLIPGPTYPEALVNLYQAEMAHVEKNYQLVSELDADLLREFDISPGRIMACLKTRLSGLRNDYWHELFSRLTKITDRLTSQSRQSLLDVLHRHVQVDFTVSNICAILIWVIKNANRYMDSQLLEVYDLMVDKCNVHPYKSNKRVWQDERWRYDSSAPQNTHFALDYRIVTHRIGGIKSGYSWEKGLDERAWNFLRDLLTIAKNLGFQCSTNDSSFDLKAEWKPGEKRSYYFTDKQGRQIELYDVRAFLNGNLHLRLNQKFILALNVEHGRLKGWLHSPEQAAEELKEPAAARYFKTNLQLNTGDPRLLLT